MVRAKGFTLLELMVGVLIFALVIGSIYYTLRVSIESFHRGEESMEIYQSVRIGLDRVGKDLRSAVSPESPWSNLAEEERRDPGGYTGMKEDEFKPKESDIAFVGDNRQVTFVVQEVIPGGDPTFDLREVRYSVDDKKKVLRREALKSIVKQRMMDWRALRFEDETTYRMDYGPAARIEGVMDTMIRNVEGVNFSYFDGADWKDSWDSNELMEEFEEEITDSDAETANPLWEARRIGLPNAVRVVLTLTNKDSVALVTEIPAKGVDELVNETPYNGSVPRGQQAARTR